MISQNLVCLVCGKDDKIQKVSAVVSTNVRSGKTTGSLTGVSHSLEGDSSSLGLAYSESVSTSATQLATMLAPLPSPPHKFGYSFFKWLLIIFFIGVIPGALFMCAAFTLLVFSGGGGGFWPADDGGLLFGLRAASVMAMLVSALIFGLVFFFFVRKNRKKVAADKEIYESLLPVWEEAMVRWNRMYYCFRDDKVFDPETSYIMAPPEMDMYLLGYKEDAP